jgi:hypothetical protein
LVTRKPPLRVLASASDNASHPITVRREGWVEGVGLGMRLAPDENGTLLASNRAVITAEPRDF